VNCGFLLRLPESLSNEIKVSAGIISGLKIR